MRASVWCRVSSWGARQCNPINLNRPAMTRFFSIAMHEAVQVGLRHVVVAWAGLQAMRVNDVAPPGAGVG
jgi:hypothetical protein